MKPQGILDQSSGEPRVLAAAVWVFPSRATPLVVFGSGRLVAQCGREVSLVVVSRGR